MTAFHRDIRASLVIVDLRRIFHTVFQQKKDKGSVCPPREAGRANKISRLILMENQYQDAPSSLLMNSGRRNVFKLRSYSSLQVSHKTGHAPIAYILEETSSR